MKDKNRPLLMIGVVCDMFNIHPQTLRLYEREGFLCPKRVGGARLYSQEDLERISDHTESNQGTRCQQGRS